ncbi:MAG: hypothetical protein C0591_06635, partial [Marinilabiliales bacterium]
MKNYLLNFDTGKIKELKKFMLVAILFIVPTLFSFGQNRTSSNTFDTQEMLAGDDCLTITCPPNVNICFTDQGANYQGYATWDPPVVSNTCSGGSVGDGFLMAFELNEQQLSEECWDFYYVQRVAVQGGYLKLWSSSSSGGDGSPFVITPYLFLQPNARSCIDIDYAGGDYNVEFWLVDENNVETLVETRAVLADGTFEFFTDNAVSGTYRLKYRFVITGSNPGNGNTVDNICADGILADDACAGGIDQVVTGPLPGYYEVGSHELTYTVTYTPPDGDPIVASCSFWLYVEGVVATATHEDALCGQPTGSITITGTSYQNPDTYPYTANYYYTLDNWDTEVAFGFGSTSATISDLSAGDYSISVKDYGLAGDCEMYNPPLEITIISTPLPNPTAVSSNVTCYGASDGTVTVTVSDGVSPLQFSLNGGSTYQEEPTFTGLGPGTYTVTVLDANSCSAVSNQVTITQPNELIASSSYDPILCYGEATTVTISATGGTQPYTGTGDFSQTVADGTVDYTVTDANGCYDIVSVTLTQPDALTCSVVQDSPVSINGEEDGEATVTPTGGT